MSEPTPSRRRSAARAAPAGRAGRPAAWFAVTRPADGDDDEQARAGYAEYSVASDAREGGGHGPVGG